MKIAILTQPIHSNYGGILQNYALQQVLRNLGHEPTTIDRHIYRKQSFIKDIAKWLLRLRHKSFDISLLSSKQKEWLSRLQLPFIEANIAKTNRIFTQKAFDLAVNEVDYDAFIVGSDQCWRPCYSPNITNYFLDFVDNSTKKIVYAASFGVDNWEYSTEISPIVRKLAQRLDYVSVRERTALSLCSEHLGIKAAWVLDPTMLLGKDGFMKFITKDTTEPFILDYLLEDSDEAKLIAQAVAHKIGVNQTRSNISPRTIRRGEKFDVYTSISVEQWLSNIFNSAFVITDSFHGAVFSILFHKPFLVKLNAVRGNARLESLLSDFELTNCICSTAAQVSIPEVDWDHTDHLLSQRRIESMNFLSKALS